jgi:hypothetical protein
VTDISLNGLSARRGLEALLPFSVLGLSDIRLKQGERLHFLKPSYDRLGDSFGK